MINTPKHRLTKPSLAFALSGALVVSMLAGSTANAQRLQPLGNNNPIYIADSPIARDSLLRLGELIAQQNLDEAVRLSDEIITTHGHRLMRLDPADADAVHIPVRRRMHLFLLEHPQLLETYRRQLTPRARVWLDHPQDWPRAAREAWLTEPGLIATLRQAQSLIEGARFATGLAMLEQLQNHPDANEHAQRASELATIGARFLQDESASALARQWAARANLPQPDLSPITPVEREQIVRASALIWTSDAHSEVSLEGIVPGALAQAPLTPITQIELMSEATPSRMSGANWKPTAWCAPLAEGTRLYTNDGFTISCFDRFTLRPIWRVQTSNQNEEIPISPDARARLGRVIEDATSITSDGRSALYAAAGIPRSGDRSGDARLLKLDRDSGRTLWSIDISTLDPALSDASIRGPIVVEKGTVVIAARTSNRRQRLISLTLVGIDSATGKMKWIQPIASAGSLPFQQMGQLAHNPIIDAGVGYYTDLIGLSVAVHLATGEVIWARPMPPPDLYARFSRPSFSGNAPVINPHGLFVLSSDGTEIFQIDPRTGKTIVSRPADQLGESLYLLGVSDDTFVCVSNNRVTYYRADRFANSSPLRSPELGNGDSAIAGRVVVMGERLLVPVHQGVQVLDLDKPTQPRLIELDQSGNIVALDGQLIVVDQMNASSFLAWDTASRLLDERISADPGASITLAELAFRADRIDDIIPSVQRAMQVIRSQPIDQRNTLQSALFNVVLDMVRNQKPHQPGDDAASAPLWERLGDQRLSTLLQSLGELARTHEQVVAHRMALGAMHERFGRTTQAVSAYQDVLDQPTLSRAMWEGSGIAVRAGLESSRRIGAIIERVGYAAYEPANTRAVNELAFLGQSTDPIAYQTLAQRYPWSRSAPAILLEAARLYRQQSRLPASIDAARAGIDHAQRLSTLGITPDPSVVEGLAERVISDLIATSRSRDAYAAARAIRESFPSITLRLQQRDITLEQLAQAAGQANTLPLLGDAFIADTKPLLLTGSPVRPVQRLDPGGVLLYAPQIARLQYNRAGRTAFEPIWERTAPGTQPPIIPWQGPSRTLVFWPESNDARDTGTLEAIETTTGELVWSLQDIRLSLEQGSTRVPDDIARVDSMIPIPTIGSMPIRQLILACDGQSVVVSDRVGRALGVDLYSGQSLWQRDLPVNRVHDLDLRHGDLGICGLMVVDHAQAQRDGSVTPIVASIDPRTGEPGQVIERFGHLPRWVRVGDQSRLFVASTERITALNIDQGALDWVLHDDDIAESEHAWISDSHLLVLGARNTLWSIDPSDGSRSSEPLDTRGRLVPRGWARLVSEIGKTTILTNAGIVSFDTKNEVVGSDARSADASLIDIAWGRSRGVELSEPVNEDNSLRCDLTLIDHTNSRLLDVTTLRVPASLGRRPTKAVAVNGGVVVGFGEVSVFVRTQEN